MYYSANLIGLQKAAANASSDTPQLMDKQFPDTDDEELLNREDIPNAKSLMPIIYKYAPDLRGRQIGMDDDLTDVNKWNEPWNDETKKLALFMELLGSKNKKDEKRRKAMVEESFNRPRFIGLDAAGEDRIELGMDLEQKYGRDLSDTDGDFYKAKSVNEILAALNKAPRLEE